jgi:hypothetical protein
VDYSPKLLGQTKRNLQREGSLRSDRAKEDLSNKVGKVIIGIVLVALAVVIHFVVSGQWGTKRFRGIEKFRGDRIEQFDPSESFALAHAPRRNVA